MCLNEFILASNSPPILALLCLMSSNCSDYEQIARKHTTMVCQHLIRTQVMGYLEKRAFETDAAIAQIGIRPY